MNRLSDEYDFNVVVEFENDMLATIIFDNDYLVKDYTDYLDCEVLMLEGAPGSNDYLLLDNKPSIEGIPLIGNQTFAQLTMARITNTEIEDLLT